MNYKKRDSPRARPLRVGIFVISSQSYLCICLILSPIKAPLDVRPVCHYQLRFRSYLSGGTKYVRRSQPRMGGTTKGKPDRNFSVRDGGEEGQSLPQRGRGPLGTIGSLTIRGINMLDTSPARGNAFVTLDNILVLFSLFSIFFSFVFSSSSTLFFFMSFDTELSFSPSFTFAPQTEVSVLFKI